MSTSTHTWQAPSGVTVTSCVPQPRDEAKDQNPFRFCVWSWGLWIQKIRSASQKEV